MSSNFVWYMGSGEAGVKYRKRVEMCARWCGFINKNGQVKLAPFIKSAVNAEIKKIEEEMRNSKVSSRGTYGSKEIGQKSVD